MKIESERLILRNWQDKDINDLVEGLNNIEVQNGWQEYLFHIQKMMLKILLIGQKHQNEEKRICLAIV